MTDGVNPQKQPKPGDDKQTLPPLLPEHTIHKKGNEPSDIDRETELSLRAYAVMVYGTTNQLTPQSRANLVEAFRYECAKVTDIVREQLRRAQNIGDSERLAYLKDYQAFCGRLTEEVERSLDRRAVDGKAVSDLSWEHLNLLDQSNFITQLHGDTLEKEFLRALASYQQQVGATPVFEDKPFGFHGRPKGNLLPQYMFKNEGASWRIIYEKYEMTVEDTKGVQYIHCLMKNPNTPMECLDIERACSGAAARDPKIVDTEEALDADLHPDTFNLKQLDDYDVTTIRRAKDTLEEKRESETDPGGKAQLEEQIQAIGNYLAKSLNVHGQPRPAGPGEEARKRVSNAVNRAKKIICKRDKTENKVVGRHFKDAIKARGTGFVYEPDRNIDWTLL